jgi:hypothetical protein
MSRLVTFGCSFTYGQGLPNCEIGNNEASFSSTPSKHAWPTKLGEMLGVNVVNMGIPGASNLEILYHLLNFDFKTNDTVVLMWSLPDRDLYFNSFNGAKPFKQLGSWMTPKNKYERDWAKNVNYKDNCIKSWLYIQHADLYLSSLTLQYIHYPSFPEVLKEFQPKFIKEITNFYNTGFIVCDQCIGDNHPGLESHVKTAEEIYKILR